MNNNLISEANKCIFPQVEKQLKFLFGNKKLKILDIGCREGFIAGRMVKSGHEVVGIDINEHAISIAKENVKNANFAVCTVYEPEIEKITGKDFDCIISTEVIEHLFDPQKLFTQSSNLLKKDGFLILSTPYHGYLKNLLISLFNSWDKHFSVKVIGGHIKFFSKNTLSDMAKTADFTNIRFFYVGRNYFVPKSMIAVAQKHS